MNIITTRVQWTFQITVRGPEVREFTLCVGVSTFSPKAVDTSAVLQLSISMDTSHKRLTIRNDEKLAPYVIEATGTSIQLGTGSYGSVEEVSLTLQHTYHAVVHWTVFNSISFILQCHTPHRCH